MEESQRYEDFVRSRITELRVRKNVSEHRMSLPSLRELFNIISYFGLTPAEFFAGFDDHNSLRHRLHEELTELSEEDLEKVSIFLSWIKK